MDWFDCTLIVIWLVMCLVWFFGVQRIKYRFRYFLKLFWNAIGRCHRCHHPLSYTGKGRGICTNLDCEKS